MTDYERFRLDEALAAEASLRQERDDLRLENQSNERAIEHLTALVMGAKCRGLRHGLHWRALARRLAAEYRDCPSLAVQMLAGHLQREIHECAALAAGLTQAEEEETASLGEIAHHLVALELPSVMGGHTA